MRQYRYVQDEKEPIMANVIAKLSPTDHHYHHHHGKKTLFK